MLGRGPCSDVFRKFRNRDVTARLEQALTGLEFEKAQHAIKVGASADHIMRNGQTALMRYATPCRQSHARTHPHAHTPDRMRCWVSCAPCSGVLYHEAKFVDFLVKEAHADLEAKSSLNETAL